jgi:hypothetical protein
VSKIDYQDFRPLLMVAQKREILTSLSTPGSLWRSHRGRYKSFGLNSSLCQHLSQDDPENKHESSERPGEKKWEGEAGSSGVTNLDKPRLYVQKVVSRYSGSACVFTFMKHVKLIDGKLAEPVCI